MLKGFWWAPVLTFVGLAAIAQWPLIERTFLSEPVAAVAPIRVSEPSWTPGAPGAATTIAATQATPRPIGSVVLASSRNPDGFAWAYPISYRFTRDSNMNGLNDIAVGDVTGDGRPDVVSYTLHKSDPTLTYRVMIYASTPDGDLALLPGGLPYASGLSDAPFYTSAGGIEVADFNNDGVDDIAMSYAFGIAIFTADGKGGFTRRSYRMPSVHKLSARSIAVLDVDRDGALDVFQYSDAPRENTLYINDRRGGFVAGRTIKFSVDPNVAYKDHKVYDFDGDGYKDLVMLWRRYNAVPDTIMVYRNIGTAGMFAAPSVTVPLPLAGWPFGSLAVGDFDGDRVSEMVAASSTNMPYAHLQFVRRNVSGQWAVAEKLPTRDIPSSLVATDVDGDGRDDLAIDHMTWETTSLYSGGDWENPTFWLASWNAMGSAHTPHALAVVDLDGDGCNESMATNTAYDLIVLWAVSCHRHVRFSSDSGSKQTAQ